MQLIEKKWIIIPSQMLIVVLSFISSSKSWHENRVYEELLKQDVYIHAKFFMPCLNSNE